MDLASRAPLRIPAWAARVIGSISSEQLLLAGLVQLLQSLALSVDGPSVGVRRKPLGCTGNSLLHYSRYPRILNLKSQLS